MNIRIFLFIFCSLLCGNTLLAQNTDDKKDENKTKDELLHEKKKLELAKLEKETLRIIDSITKAENIKNNNSLSEILLTGNIPYKFLSIPLNSIIDYNNFEGFSLGLGIMTNEKISQHFSVGGYFAYGFKDKTWKYGGDLFVNLHQDSESKIHFDYTNDLTEKSAYSFLEERDLSSSEVFRKYMIENMDLIEKFQIEFNALAFKYFKFNLYINQSHITSTDGYSFGRTLVDSTNQFNFSEIGFQFRYAYNEKFKQTSKSKYSLGTNYPVICGNISRGTNWFDGEYTYTKYEVKLTKKFLTKALGKTKLTFVGGLVDGDVPISKMYNGHGSHKPFNVETENSFGTMRMGEFYSDKFFSIFFKHEFKSLFEKAEIFNPRFAIVNNFGIGEFPQNSKHHSLTPIKSIEKGYYEGGLLINNILQGPYSALGFGVLYRYGPYSFSNEADNFSYKFSLTIAL